MQSISSTQIRSFWEWFSRAANELEGDFGNDELLEELDTKVRQLGPVSWEIGPGMTKDFLLVITPDGDASRLALTRHIVELAPSLSRWEVHPAKPPKQWDFRFSVDVGDCDLQLDASEWSYVLYRYPDNIFDITVVAPELALTSASHHEWIVTIAIDSAVGEEARLKSFATIEVAVEAGERVTVPFTHLRDQFRQLGRD